MRWLCISLSISASVCLSFFYTIFLASFNSPCSSVHSILELATFWGACRQLEFCYVGSLVEHVLMPASAQMFSCLAARLPATCQLQLTTCHLWHRITCRAVTTTSYQWVSNRNLISHLLLPLCIYLLHLRLFTCSSCSSSTIATHSLSFCGIPCK